MEKNGGKKIGDFFHSWQLYGSLEMANHCADGKDTGRKTEVSKSMGKQ
jgi:hypothetical protein